MENLIKQLKQIDVKARPEWKLETRNFLLAQIKQDKLGIQAPSQKEKLTRIVQELLRNLKLARLAWRPAGILAIAFLFLILGSGVLVSAAQKAVPGEKMFIVKRAIEKGELLLASSNAQEAELASAFLGKRVNELQKLMWQQTELVAASGQQRQKIEKTEDIVLAVEEVNKQLDDVNQKVKKLKTSDQQAGITAMILNQKINNYKKELKQVKKKVTDKQAEAKLDQALNQVGDLNGNLLAVIVAKHQKGELKVDTKEIEDKLSDHLSDIEEKAQDVKKQLGEKVLANKQDITQLKDKTKLVEEKIRYAKQAIKEDKFGLVLTLAKDSNKMLEMLYGEVDKVIDNSQAAQDTTDGQVKGASDENGGQIKVKADTAAASQGAKDDVNLSAPNAEKDIKTGKGNEADSNSTSTPKNKETPTVTKESDGDANSSQQNFNATAEDKAVKSEFNVGIQ